MRRAARRDESEPGIVDAFREGGASVTPLSAKGIPDLLVGFCGVTHLVEAKTGNAGLTEAQMEFRASWSGEPPVDVRTPAQARRWLAVWSRRKPSLTDVVRAEHSATRAAMLKALAGEEGS